VNQDKNPLSAPELAQFSVEFPWLVARLGEPVRGWTDGCNRTVEFADGSRGRVEVDRAAWDQLAAALIAEYVSLAGESSSA
jgi:hypothetical protein